MRNWMRAACCLIMLSLLLISTPVWAQSLWSDNSPAANLFTDRKARAVGDTVTILINENSSAVRSGAANNAKSANVDMKAGTGIFGWIAAANAETSDKFDAKGTLTNTNKVNAKLTTTVTEVKPNGSMVITGTQTIKQNNEEQKITITGIVRPDDIAADNTVLSTYVADAQIKIDGKGPVANKQRQGILSQILNILFSLT